MYWLSCPLWRAVNHYLIAFSALPNVIKTCTFADVRLIELIHPCRRCASFAENQDQNIEPFTAALIFTGSVLQSYLNFCHGQNIEFCLHPTLRDCLFVLGGGRSPPPPHAARHCAQQRRRSATRCAGGMNTRRSLIN